MNKILKTSTLCLIAMTIAVQPLCGQQTTEKAGKQTQDKKQSGDQDKTQRDEDKAQSDVGKQKKQKATAIRPAGAVPALPQPRPRAIALPAVRLVPTASARPVNSELAHLYRLTQALRNFKSPEQAQESITVWRQIGQTGISITIDEDAEDLFTALRGFGENWKENDVENVFVLSGDRRNIRILDLSKPEDVKMSDLELQRGDLVVLLKSNERR